MELNDVDGEKDCCRSCLDGGADVGEAKSSDFERLAADKGVARDMSELYDLVKEFCRPWNGEVSGLRSWSSILPPDIGPVYMRCCQNRRPESVHEEQQTCSWDQCTMDRAVDCALSSQSQAVISSTVCCLGG